ncbi:hypothetical protein C8J57DRAFT_1232346 [Mycena rebaudengoi]|nr:hypothetical protein C8J57DRAFT_1232346 [Mycena rebaudengoi]
MGYNIENFVWKWARERRACAFKHWGLNSPRSIPAAKLNLKNGLKSRRALEKQQDLAGAPEVYDKLTDPATILLTTLWILHLITTQSLSSDGWFTLAVGALGMIQNTIAAGTRRTPAALGLPLDEINSVTEEKVFPTLQKADSFEPGVGLALLDVFFPGGLWEDEEMWRETRKKEIALMKAKIN